MKADGRDVSGHDEYEYYVDPYVEFYVCRQWEKNYHVDNARSLLAFVTGIAEEKTDESNVTRLAKHEKSFRAYINRHEARILHLRSGREGND